MKKILAVLCTISWSCFWVCGYLALSAAASSESQLIYLVLSGIGFLLGVISYLKIAHLQGPQVWRHVKQQPVNPQP